MGIALLGEITKKGQNREHLNNTLYSMTQFSVHEPHRHTPMRHNPLAQPEAQVNSLENKRSQDQHQTKNEETSEQKRTCTSIAPSFNTPSFTDTNGKTDLCQAESRTDPQHLVLIHRAATQDTLLLIAYHPTKPKKIRQKTRRPGRSHPVSLFSRRPSRGSVNPSAIDYIT